MCLPETRVSARDPRVYCLPFILPDVPPEDIASIRGRFPRLPLVE